MGNRVEKSNGTLYWYGQGGEVLDETDLSGNLKDEYVYFGGKRVAMRNSSGSIYYYVEGHLGSARVMTNASGNVCYDADFLPYGQEVDFTSTCGSHYKFEGKERDQETGNDDFGARYYRSLVGRWLSPDWSAIPAPVPYANLTNPQTLNLYAMVSDNPETFADLDGHLLGTGASGGDSGSGDGSNAASSTDDTGSSSNCAGGVVGCAHSTNPATQTQAQQQALTNVTYNEAGSLRPDQNAKLGQPGSAQDLANGRQAIAEIANRVINAGHPDRVAPSVLTPSAKSAIKNGVPAAVDAYNMSAVAARAALGGSNISNGATQYRTRVGTNITTPVGRSRTYPGTPVSQHYGPFLEGNHKVVIVVAQ